MRKPQDWGQPCPNPDCSHYRLINRGNMSAISTYMTQSGKRRIFRCSKCERPFSETRDTVFFDLRSPEDKGFCRKVRFLGQNPKIGYQEFNDLQTHKLSKKQLCDRTEITPSPHHAM